MMSAPAPTSRLLGMSCDGNDCGVHPRERLFMGDAPFPCGTRGPAVRLIAKMCRAPTRMVSSERIPDSRCEREPRIEAAFDGQNSLKDVELFNRCGHLRTASPHFSLSGWMRHIDPALAKEFTN